MAATALKKITTRAKAIRRAHPNMTWMSAVKKASAEYRGSGGKKKSPKKKKPGKKRIGSNHAARSTQKQPASIAGLSTSQLRTHLKKAYREKLAWGLLSVESANKVKTKKAARKRVAVIKKQLKALQ